MMNTKRAATIAFGLGLLVPLSACATMEDEEGQVVASTENDGVAPLACPTTPCPGHEEPPPPPPPPASCDSACNSTATCTKACTGTAGVTTCGAFGRCQVCNATNCMMPSTCGKKCLLNGGPQQSTCSDWSRTARGDADVDGIPDWLELALAKKFYPDLNMHCENYNGQPYGSKGQYYGSGVHCGASNENNLPARVRRVGPFSNGLCPNGECIEIVYGFPYASDLGDDSTNIGKHPGDTEGYAVLLAFRRQPGDFPNEWGTATSLTQAFQSTGYWARIKERAFAHGCDSGDNKFRRSGSFLAQYSFSEATLYVAEGKNATYFSVEDCDNGNYWRDNCGDSRCTLSRSIGQQRLINTGELECHPLSAFETMIPAAAASWGACGLPNRYEVWSGLGYQHGSPFRDILRPNWIDWGANTVSCP